MTRQFVVTGTDTGVGKTVVAAMLVQALGAAYWKPVQAGGDDESDTEIVKQLAGLAPIDLLPEAYFLTTPVSPHLAAKIDGVEIDVAKLNPPGVDKTLIIEGAGGVLVPLTGATLFADVFAHWQLPVILCARTALGGINHALLSLEALRLRNCPIHGVIFVGDEMSDTEQTICKIGGVRRLGRLPMVRELSRETLAQAFSEHFDIADFTAAGGS